MRSDKKETIKKIFSRHNMVVFAAMATSLASSTITPPDNIEPGLVKDEITLSAIAKKPSSGSSRGKNYSGGENPFLKEDKKLEFEKTDLLKALQISKVSLAKTAQFFTNYRNNLDDNGKISSKALAKSAKDAEITTAQFTTMVENLREINKTKKLNRISRADAKGYDYFEKPIDFKIDDKGEAIFTTKVVINDNETYQKDIQKISKAIEKTKKIDNDAINLEAVSLMLKAFACSELRKMIDDNKDIPNSGKLMENFDKDLKEYNLVLGNDGKLEKREDSKKIKLNPNLSIWNSKNYRAAG